MCCNKAQCTTVLQVATSASLVTLPESNRIRNSIVVGIAMRRLNGVATTSKTGATLAVDAVTQSAHLSLCNANGTEILDIPLQYLQRDFNSPEWLKVNGLRNIDPTQSTIVLNTGAAGYSATAVFEIMFELECDNCGVTVKAKN